MTKLQDKAIVPPLEVAFIFYEQIAASFSETLPLLRMPFPQYRYQRILVHAQP